MTDLTIKQGATYEDTFWFTHRVFASFSGYTVRGKIRPSYASATVTLDMSTVATPIALNATLHTLKIVLSAAETAALTAGRYVYDVEIVDGSGTVTRLLEGSVVVTPEVTR